MSQLWIAVDTQKAAEYFEEHVFPYKVGPDDPAAADQEPEWFDRWLESIVGMQCVEGNDIDLLYPYDGRTIKILDLLGIVYEVRSDPF